jgi:hypothetical protein
MRLTLTSTLRPGGWVLVAHDPLVPPDAIVLTVDVHERGVVGAISLVTAGVSRRVAFFVASHWHVDEVLATPCPRVRRCHLISSAILATCSRLSMTWS